MIFECNRKVEDQILSILRDRMYDCLFYHHYGPDQQKYCQKELSDYKTAETNWFIKCKHSRLYIFLCIWNIGKYVRFLNNMYDVSITALHSIHKHLCHVVCYNNIMQSHSNPSVAEIADLK